MVATTDRTDGATDVAAEKARLFDLLAFVMKLIMDGKRKIGGFIRVLQEMKDNPKFEAKFFTKTEPITYPPANWLLFWTKLYRDHFQLELDTANLKIPEQKPGLNWFVVVAKGLTPNRIFAVMAKLFPSWRYTDDLDVITSVRKTTETYAIWCRDCVEADEELKNKSATDLAREKVNCMTFEERGLLEIMYFVRTGEHLDLQNWTLCRGSCRPDGHVPSVSWDPDDRAVDVSWSAPDYRRARIRAREVVS